MNSCLLPGNDYPVAVILGCSGSGRTSVGQAVAEQMSAPFVESEEVAEEMLGHSLAAEFNLDVGQAHRSLNDAALEVLRQGGAGAGAVVSLSPSAILDDAVMGAVLECRAAGTPVVALEASLNTLTHRTGLNAQRPVFMGTPRAWFRQQTAELNAAFEKVTDHFFATDDTTPLEVGLSIVNTVRLDSGSK